MLSGRILFPLALSLVGCMGSARIQSAQQQVIMDATDADAWVALGDAYARGRQQQKAREAYNRALALDSNNARAQSAMAELRTGRPPKIVREALRNPEDDEMWGDVGDYYASIGNNQEALRTYLYALSLDPADSEWQSSAAGLGGGEEVLTVMMANLNQNDDEQLGNVGDVLMQLNRSSEGCEYYQRALQIDPSDNEWIRKVGSCGGSIPDSVGYSSDAVRLAQQNPQDDELQGDAGDYYASIGNNEEAVRLYLYALSLDPTDAEWQNSATGLGAGEEVLGVMMRHLNPNDDEQLGNVGDVLMQLNRNAEACEYFRRALIIDTDDSEWIRKSQECVTVPAPGSWNSGGDLKNR